MPAITYEATFRNVAGIVVWAFSLEMTSPRLIPTASGYNPSAIMTWLDITLRGRIPANGRANDLILAGLVAWFFVLTVILVVGPNVHPLLVAQLLPKEVEQSKRCRFQAVCNASQATLSDFLGDLVIYSTLNTISKTCSTRLIGDPRQRVLNIGCGSCKWGGIYSKTCANLALVEQIMATNPLQLVVLVDGADLMHGRCNESDLVARYEAVVASSNGAAVVFGAEPHCFPCDIGLMKRYVELRDPRFAESLKKLNLPPSLYDMHLACSHEIAHSSCIDPPRLRFLNGGFAMGPAKSLQPMLHYACESLLLLRGTGHGGRSEQRFLHKYLLDHPDEVTLDHAGLLALNLFGFRNQSEVIDIVRRDWGGPAPPWADDAPATLVNKVLDRRQCFVHGNGPIQYKDRATSLGSALEDIFRRNLTEAICKASHTILPDFLGDLVLFATLNTRLRNCSTRLISDPHQNVLNVGCGSCTWDGIHSKACANLALVERIMATNPQQLVVLFNGIDLVSGRCNASELVARYEAVVASSNGAAVVFGAEYHCFSCDDGITERYVKLKDRRINESLRKMGLTPSMYRRHLACSNETELFNFTDPLVQEIARSKCFNPPKLRFLNGGFVIGPAKNLQPILKYACDNLLQLQLQDAGHGDRSELRFFHTYLLDHPVEVTLDHAGLLALTCPAFATSRRSSTS